MLQQHGHNSLVSFVRRTPWNRKHFVKRVMKTRVVIDRNCDTPLPRYFMGQRWHWQMYRLKCILDSKLYTNWIQCTLSLHPLLYEIPVLLHTDGIRNVHISHTPPRELEYRYGDIWACPTECEKIQQQQQIHVPNWKVIIGLVCDDVWWTAARREGKQAVPPPGPSLHGSYILRQ